MKKHLSRKHAKKEPFTKSEIEWMDKHDWHPVDELPMKKLFIRSLQKSMNEKTKPISLKELFGKGK